MIYKKLKFVNVLAKKLLSTNCKILKHNCGVNYFFFVENNNKCYTLCHENYKNNKLFYC